MRKREKSIGGDNPSLQVISLLLVLALLATSTVFFFEALKQKKEQDILGDLIRVEEQENPISIDDETPEGTEEFAEFGMIKFLDSFEQDSSTTTFANNPYEWSCAPVELAPILVRSVFDSTSNATATIYQYAPGLSAQALSQWVRSIRDCARGLNPITIINSKDDALFVARNSSKSEETIYEYSLVVGDSIVVFADLDKDRANTLRDFWFELTREKLERSGCLSLSVTRADFSRNHIHNPDYLGWERQRELNSDFFLPQISAGVYVPGESISGASGIIYADSALSTELVEVSPLTPSVPEYPLPEGVATELPVLETITKPVTPTASKIVVTEVVEDVYGPGCGWQWVGFSSPALTEGVLQQHTSDINEDQLSLSLQEIERFVAYSTENYNYSRSLGASNAKILEYNSIVQEWERINEERARWDEDMSRYVTDKNDYDNFLEAKAQAEQDYARQLASCQPATPPTPTPEDPDSEEFPAPEEGEDEALNPLPTPSASPAPTAPPTPSPAPEDTCNVVRPDILDQQPPVLPQPPLAPASGIPNSLQLKYSEYLSDIVDSSQE